MRFKKVAIFLTAFSIFINATANAQPIIFDFKNGDSSVLEKFKSYRKCSGFLKAYMYGLPVVPCGVVVDEYLSETDIENIRTSVGEILMCRSDAPFKSWFGLPRGRELKPETINDFLALCRESNPEAALLLFPSPPIYFTGKHIERYSTIGSINVVIDWEKSITIEYVGQGFDGGELTKGKNKSHTIINIPWHVSEWPAEFIWDFAEIQNASQEMYSTSREQRIRALIELGYSKEIVESAIPDEPVYMNKKNFVNIFKNCIKGVVKYARDFDPKVPTMILIDLYGEKQHVVEIWNSNS